jgi:hypothetical protein
MNTPTLRSASLASALALAFAGGFALSSPASAAPKQEAPAYENYVSFSAGTALQSGDRPAFQKALQIKKSGYGGLEDLFVTRQIDDATVLKIRARALAGNNDFLLDFNVTRDDVGYLSFGYREFRVFYDGSGAYWPPKNMLTNLYNEDLATDRGNLWFEAGYTPADAINFVFRYDLFTRDGTKDSHAYGDSGMPISAALTRGTLPTFWKLDEKRHQLTAKVFQRGDRHIWSLGARYDKGEYTNSRNMRRRALEPQDRRVTHKEGQDYDLSQFRGSYENRISDQLTVTTAAARTTIDTILSGSRIYGSQYDAVYDPVLPARQQRDEGFFDLHGESEMKQTIVTLNVLFRPTETLSLIPSARFEKIDWSNKLEFEETNVGGGPAFAAILDEVEADSNKEWKVMTQSFEVRYLGLKDWTLNATAELSKSDGELDEIRILEPGTPIQAISIDRVTDFDRTTQKLAATANWYPAPGTTLAFQYYYKARQNDYRARRDNTVSTSDRYPAYISNQDFETNDFNVRLSKRLPGGMRSVTRYDYQETLLKTQDIGLAFVETAKMKTHILSQSLSWNPKPQWYVQGSINAVWDTMKTPAFTLTGPAANVVKNSDGNYVSVSIGSGYALDDNSDLYVDYNAYSVYNSYVNNSDVSVPFGTEGTSQVISATWTRKLDSRTQLTVKYAFADRKDDTMGGLGDYDAHLLYGKIQYRF